MVVDLYIQTVYILFTKKKDISSSVYFWFQFVGQFWGVYFNLHNGKTYFFSWNVIEKKKDYLKFYKGSIKKSLKKDACRYFLLSSGNTCNLFTLIFRLHKPSVLGVDCNRNETWRMQFLFFSLFSALYLEQDRPKLTSASMG